MHQGIVSGHGTITITYKHSKQVKKILRQRKTLHFIKSVLFPYTSVQCDFSDLLHECSNKEVKITAGTLQRSKSSSSLNGVTITNIFCNATKESVKKCLDNTQIIFLNSF